jgi:CRP/FNR family transcriptional regulator, cyclic AMP receptor protein
MSRVSDEWLAPTVGGAVGLPEDAKDDIKDVASVDANEANEQESSGIPVAPGDTLRLLSRINLFSGLPQVYLQRIEALGQVENHPLGAQVFAEGSPGDKVYLILEGKVRISRTVPGIGEEALAVLKAGDYFGEMALIDDFPRSADARVHEAARLFVISKEHLQDLLFIDRELAYELLWNFVRTLSGRLRESNDKMTFLAASSRF